MMMIEKRFKIYQDSIRKFESNRIWGVKSETNSLEPYMTFKEAEKCCDFMNNQQAEIDDLKEENEKLRQMIKENVFQRYREGSLADLEFKAIAYDDIVKVEMSNESEPKVIVSCRQGKKENVKSFCQMFIPFGVYYEIKELEE